MYHHVLMLVGSWMSAKYFPGGQLYVLGYINCFVHLVMYFYYFLTSWDSAYKNNIWWKKNLTQLQIVSPSSLRFTEEYTCSRFNTAWCFYLF